MTGDEFRSSYQLLKRVTQDGVGTFHAVGPGGAVVMVHVLGSADQAREMEASIERLSPADRARVLDSFDVEGSPVLITKFVLDFQSLESWMDERLAAAEAPPAHGPPIAAPADDAPEPEPPLSDPAEPTDEPPGQALPQEPGFTAAFATIGSEPDSPETPPDPGPAPPSPPEPVLPPAPTEAGADSPPPGVDPPEQDTRGTLTASFEAFGEPPADVVAPSSTASAPRPAAAPPSSAEAPPISEAPPIPPPPPISEAAAVEKGEFTQLFEALGGEDAGPSPAAPPADAPTPPAPAAHATPPVPAGDGDPEPEDIVPETTLPGPTAKLPWEEELPLDDHDGGARPTSGFDLQAPPFAGGGATAPLSPLPAEPPLGEPPASAVPPPIVEPPETTATPPPASAEPGPLTRQFEAGAPPGGTGPAERPPETPFPAFDRPAPSGGPDADAGWLSALGDAPLQPPEEGDDYLDRLYSTDDGTPPGGVAGRAGPPDEVPRNAPASGPGTAMPGPGPSPPPVQAGPGEYTRIISAIPVDGPAAPPLPPDSLPKATGRLAQGPSRRVVIVVVVATVLLTVIAAVVFVVARFVAPAVRRMMDEPAAPDSAATGEGGPDR